MGGAGGRLSVRISASVTVTATAVVTAIVAAAVVTAARRDGARAAATLVFTPLATWRGVGGEAVLRIFHLARGRGHTLHLFAIAVDAGNLNGGVGQFVLQVNVRSEDDAAAGNEASLNLVHGGNTGGNTGGGGGQN